jgi:DNA-binding transcriptional regulator YhcF (GntR family)
MPTEGGDKGLTLEDINLDSGVAVFMQIENHFRFAIASGRLEAGERLPSVTDLSERIGVNPNTVAKAYRDLEVMGLVHARRGRGVFVSKGIRAKCEEDCRARIIKGLNEVVGEAKAAGMAVAELNDAVKAIYSADGGLYCSMPKSVAALIKQKKGGS